MKKGLIASLIVALVAVGVTAAFAFGPGYGMGMGSGNGTCAMAGGTVSPEQSQKFAKFQSDILPLKQKMLQLRTELMTLRSQTPTDWKAISAKQKEMVDVRIEIQKRATDSGFAGAGYGPCGYGCGNGQGRTGMDAGMGRMER
jgi:Spy/CpxP family protein refolding chaperone